MAKGVLEFSEAVGVNMRESIPVKIERDVFTFLDSFYSSRIGIRVLIQQHVAVHEPREGYIGIINVNMVPQLVVEVGFA